MFFGLMEAKVAGKRTSFGDREDWNFELDVIQEVIQKGLIRIIV